MISQRAESPIANHKFKAVSHRWKEHDPHESACKYQKNQS